MVAIAGRLQGRRLEPCSTAEPGRPDSGPPGQRQLKARRTARRPPPARGANFGRPVPPSRPPAARPVAAACVEAARANQAGRPPSVVLWRMRGIKAKSGRVKIRCCDSTMPLRHALPVTTACPGRFYQPVSPRDPVLGTKNNPESRFPSPPPSWEEFCPSFHRLAVMPDAVLQSGPGT